MMPDLPLIFYTLAAVPGHHQPIHPAADRRDWMDHTPNRFAYRCLPMTIANTAGWEILTTGAFEAVWNGEEPKESTTITPLGGDAPGNPVSCFGSGIVTFHIGGIFRTPPGWNLFCTGPLNRPKHGISPLTGIIETDWASATFTMNWKLTRPFEPVKFERGDPFCHVFPVPRGMFEQFKPVVRPLSSDPDLAQKFHRWSCERLKFNRRLESEYLTGNAAWQRHYFSGHHIDGSVAPDHQTKLRLRRFQVDDNSTLE